MNLKVGNDAKFISNIDFNGIKVRYSKILSINEDKSIIELANAMKLKFMHKSDETGNIWDTYLNVATGKTVLVYSDI